MNSNRLTRLARLAQGAALIGVAACHDESTSTPAIPSNTPAINAPAKPTASGTNVLGAPSQDPSALPTDEPRPPKIYTNSPRPPDPEPAPSVSAKPAKHG